MEAMNFNTHWIRGLCDYDAALLADYLKTAKTFTSAELAEAAQLSKVDAHAVCLLLGTRLGATLSFRVFKDGEHVETRPMSLGFCREDDDRTAYAFECQTHAPVWFACGSVGCAVLQ